MIEPSLTVIILNRSVNENPEILQSYLLIRTSFISHKVCRKNIVRKFVAVCFPVEEDVYIVYFSRVFVTIFAISYLYTELLELESGQTAKLDRGGGQKNLAELRCEAIISKKYQRCANEAKKYKIYAELLH